LNDAVTLTAGKIDLTNYFDINRAANDETSQFLAAAFVNGAALPAVAAAPGVRARTVLFGRISAQAGVVSPDGTGGSRFENSFRIGSLGVRLRPDTEVEGNLRVYVHHLADEGTGWGASLDQELGAGFMAFARHGENDDEASRRTSVRRASSGGLQWLRPGKGPRVALAAACGRTIDAQGRRTMIGEAYASWQLNPWTHVSPMIQVVKDEAFMAEAAVAAGLRLQFNF